MEDRFFFIVGAQRSSTSYLYNLLDEHPEIQMAKPLQPEPKFFLSDDEWQLGIDHYVKKYYSRDDNTRVFGEKSTSYLENPDAGRRIKKMIPDAKVIIMLRNPVTRALSNYFFSKGNNLETRSLSEVFIDKIDEPVTDTKTSVSPFRYLKRGLYEQFIRSYHDIFDDDNIIILIREEFIQNSEGIESLYARLNVEPSFLPTSIDSSVNRSHIDYVDSQIEDVPQVLRAYYEKSITSLEEYLGRDLTCWNQS